MMEASFASSNSSLNSTSQPGDTFKILIATDIHLGVHEKDPIRSDDSFNTFEEILLAGKEKNVDFILLGGDLFHDSKPSQSCYVKAISLIREHTMGDKAIDVAFISKPEVFQNSVIGDVNYQDPNQNVSYPIFSIHGNHDDPSGFGRTSALDVLSSTGQVNYFGVCKDLNNIVLKPLLFRKGRTKLAIYGISHVRDERLSRLMSIGSVTYEEPPNFGSWFKILVLHQNRVPRAGTKHIKEKWIPDFIDFVFWGHEHECLITPERTVEPDKSFYNVQPGSPVATSLCEAESVAKKIGVLHVCQKQFNMEEIKLQTVRPFVFHTESTRDWRPCANMNKMAELVKKYIDTNVMVKVREQLTGHSKQPILPLIRLRLEIDDSCLKFNAIRFGQSFYSSKVANPTDMLIIRTPGLSNGEKAGMPFIKAADLEDLLDTTGIKAEALAPAFFEIEENKPRTLKVLGIAGMCEAVTNFVAKDDKLSIAAMVNHQIKETRDYLKSQRDLTCDRTVIHDLIGRFGQMRSMMDPEEEVEKARQYLDGENRLEQSGVDYRLLEGVGGGGEQLEGRDAPAAVAKAEVSPVSSDCEFPPPPETVQPAAKRVRGRGRGRAGSNTTASTRAKGARSAANSSTSSAQGARSGGSTVSSTASSTGNRSILDFTTRKIYSNDGRREIDPFDDFLTSSPRKKAKIVYVEDSD